MPFFDLKETLANKIASFLQRPELSREKIVGMFTAPPKIEMGHVALPCFQLAKVMGRPSHELAKEIAAQFQSKEIDTNPTGPYVNFRWNINALYTNTLSRIESECERFGSDEFGEGKRVIFEYCSPNVAKKLAFQHIRSMLIGNTLSNIFKFLGYRVERINFVGDWGTQFARLLAAFELWGDEKKLSLKDTEAAMEHLFRLYVRFHKDLDNDESYLESASKCLQRLEDKEPRAMELWKKNSEH